MKKQRILIVSLAVCLAAIIGFGSLAYFTAQDSIENAFMVAGYDPNNPAPDPNSLFSISVYETDNTKTGGATTETGNTYSSIQPGDKLTKDPTVKNTGKYDAWIRVHVTIGEYSDWQKILTANKISNLTTLFGGLDSTKWTSAETKTDTTADTITYSYYLNTALAPEATAKLFDTVTIPTSITVDQLVTIASFKVTITADAIQAKNTGSTPAEAFKLYDAQVSGA